jgi:predicted nucleotidyltransferase
VTVSAVARRRAERAQLIAAVARWANALSNRLAGLHGVVVVGSVARGDFNRWSDTDVLVVADRLPDDWLPRSEAVGSAPAGIQVIAWTPEEYANRARRRDPIAMEAVGPGVVVWGALP